MTTSLPNKQLFLLGLLIALAAFNVCAYSPALPVLAQAFHQNVNHTQFLIVISLLGNAITSILFAIFANRFGFLFSTRIGLSLCLLGDSFAILTYHLVPHFSLLMIGILLLSLGGNVGMVIALATLKEAASKHLQSYTTLTMMSFAILPGAAILLASFLLSYAFWVSIFVFLAIYHAFLFCACGYLPKIILPEQKAFSFKILKQPHFVLCLILGGIFSGMIYSFTAQSPHIAMDILGQKPMAFGWWSNLLSVGMFIGLGLALRYNKYYSLAQILRASIIIMALALVIGTQQNNIITFYLYCTLISIATQLSYPYVTSEAMKIKHNSPSSAALFNIGHSLIASGFVWLANHLSYQGYHNLWMSYLVGVVLLWGCYLLIKNRQ